MLGESGVQGERYCFGWQLKQRQGRSPLPFPVKVRVSLLPRDDEGTVAFCLLRSIRSIRAIRIFHLSEPARAAVAVPGKGRAIQRVNNFGYGLNESNG